MSHLFLHVDVHTVVHVPAKTHSHSEKLNHKTKRPPCPCWTYLVSQCFSVNTLKTKSASFEGSNVDGTIRYSPGGRRSLALTSLRLMNVSERAQEDCRRKNSFFMWTLGEPLTCQVPSSVRRDGVTKTIKQKWYKSVFG